VTPAGTATSWSAVLGQLLAGQDLDFESAAWAMERILTGEATSAQIAGFVTALRAKGESPDEVNALVTVMLQHARLLDLGPTAPPVVLDVVGTGGDQAHTVNISTMTALVCAAAGAPVVKHGNRAASSSTGTADVLEELGVAIDIEPDAVSECVATVGIGFCFALTHHPAMRYAGPTRRELGVPTVFNILGPLTNPGGAGAALIGCASVTMAPVMADVLSRRGVKALVVRGDDGLDEISTVTTTTVWDATSGSVVLTHLDPDDLGIARVDPALLRGGDPARNAELLRKVFRGVAASDVDSDRVSAITEAVALNAAAALVAFAAATAPDAAEPLRPLADRVRDKLALTREVIATGAADRLLDDWIAVSRSLKR
jgi:anthranilate phosphoribosyltransferase